MLKINPDAGAVDSPAADMSHAADVPAPVVGDERRSTRDRRKRVVYSLFYGSFKPRRRKARRTDARSLRDLDWHPPHWLAVAILITLLSCGDAALTLTLMEHGAYEVNPIMASIVGGSALVFTLVKVGLTAGGVVLLTLAARMRAFGKIPVSFLLYGVLLAYAILIVYELRLLEQTLPTY
jgi:hypothetical protein